jgi:hypothetical protein
LPVLKVLNQGGIEPRNQFRGGGHSTADELVPGLLDQRPHLGGPLGIVGPLHEDQSVLMELGGLLELPLSGRDTLSVLVAIVVAEQPEVDVAAFHLVQIHLIGPTVRRGNLLEQETLEEAPQEGISEEVVPEGHALLRELLLHAADENAQGLHTNPILPPRRDSIMPSLWGGEQLPPVAPPGYCLPCWRNGTGLLGFSGLKCVLRTDYARGTTQIITSGMPGGLLVRLPAYWGWHSQVVLPGDGYGYKGHIQARYPVQRLRR